MIKNKNYLDIFHKSVGNERRKEYLGEVLDRNAFLPKTVLYEDIDNAFKEWVKNDVTLISDEGVEFPTMTLFSSQRFSEYAQTWEYVDSNNNLLLNFKTISRDTNPQKGELNGNIYNIPGERYYTIKQGKVLDDNGTESYLKTSMRLPTPVNLIYHISVFTNKYDKVNEFNTIINKSFASRQCYIAPNGHYMPMVIDSVDDKSEYNIDDRQFYGQTVNIKVMGYIITESDYRIDEIPLKKGGYLNMMDNSDRRKAKVEIEESEPEYSYEMDSPCFEDVDGKTYYNKELILSILFPKCITKSEFTIDTDFVVTSVKTENIMNNYKIYVNGDLVDVLNEGFEFKEGDVIKVKIKTYITNNETYMKIYGYDPNIAYDEDNDFTESELDENKNEEMTIEN